MKRKLNEENINISCEEADSFLRKRKTDSKDRIRMMLSMKETLLKYKDSFGADSEYIVDFGSGFHRNRIRLTVPGRELDPFSPSGFTSDEERFMQGMLTRLARFCINREYLYCSGLLRSALRKVKEQKCRWPGLLRQQLSVLFFLPRHLRFPAE